MVSGEDTARSCIGNFLLLFNCERLGYEEEEEEEEQQQQQQQQNKKEIHKLVSREAARLKK